jgi:hypothetical protein
MGRRRHRLAVAALLAVGLAAAAALALAAGEGEPKKAARPRLALPNAAALARAVGPAGIERHMAALQRIAARNSGNRAAGTTGYRDSAEYVKARLRAAGWRVSEAAVAFPYFEERSPLRVRADGRVLHAATLRFSGSGAVRARAVPVGGGCHVADYRGLPRGAVAVAARGGCLLQAIALSAQRAGAGAVVVWDPTRGGPPLAATLIRPGARIPVVAVRRTAGRRLARRRPLVRVRVDASSGRRTDAAVLAELGRGPRTVMAGAHLDSVPEGPGVNDNGSGVGTLLEIAEQAGRARERPKRRLRLAFWAAEEPGLYGSRRYVRGLSHDERRRLTAYVNLDMVGSANGGRFFYGGRKRGALGAARAVRHYYRRQGVRLERIGAGSSSDHAPFQSAGVPVLGLFSGANEVKSAAERRRWGGRAGRAFDTCYHLSCDRLARVDRRTLSELSDGVAVALYRLAWR